MAQARQAEHAAAVELLTQVLEAGSGCGGVPALAYGGGEDLRS